MRNVDYYKTPNELATAFAALSAQWCTKACAQCPVAPTETSKSATCSARFAYAEHTPTAKPIPAWLTTNTLLLDNSSGRIFNVLEVKADANAIAIHINLHTDGIHPQERTESFYDAQAILNCYTPVTLEKVPT